MERCMGNRCCGWWGRVRRSPQWWPVPGATATHCPYAVFYGHQGGGATPSTSTSTPGVVARSAALGHFAASMMLRVSCAYGRSGSLSPRSFVRIPLSEVMGLPRKSRLSVGRLLYFRSVISEMPALQGRPPVPKRAYVAWAIVAETKYELAMYKNPKVGHKPPRLVPFLTNRWYGEEVPKDRRWNPLPLVVACCREFSRAVDGANQMALQMRQRGNQMTWSHTMRAFLVRCAATNAFATARALGLVDEKTTMCNLKQPYFSGADFNDTTPSAPVHTSFAPKRFASRLFRTHCRSGSTLWACGARGKHMHIKCFGDTHDV